jgi:hypothetical protein
MKKILAAVFLIILGAGYASARKSGGSRPAFDVGDNAIGIALGVGTAHTYGLADVYSPAFIVNYEHGIIGNLGPGTLSIGGELGYQTSYYDYTNGGYRARWTTLSFAVRGIYHLTILKDKNNKFDPYGGLALGFYAVNYRNDYPGYYENYPSVPFVAPFVGAKYNFTPGFGVWTELGYDIAILKFGLNFNF